MLHFTHSGNTTELIAEGSRGRFLENLRESDAWDKLSEDQQETID